LHQRLTMGTLKWFDSFGTQLHVPSKDSIWPHYSTQCVRRGWRRIERRPHVRSQLARVARLLLQHGADVHARTEKTTEPLQCGPIWGTRGGSVLLEYGAADEHRLKRVGPGTGCVGSSKPRGMNLLEYGGRSSDRKWSANARTRVGCPRVR